jgi:ubiquinone/menaquinone biosynthesis C-methylase UbiE
MTDWYRHWNSWPAQQGEDEYLRQVGKTVSGQPIPEADLDVMAGDVARALDLHTNDRLLDLCCGNGLITCRYAQRSRDVTGVDFSAPLIAIARAHFARSNIEYIVADACDLPETVMRTRFTKICLYEALQHFTTAQAETLLRELRRSAARAAPVFWGAVPDEDRKWAFYDTAQRREEYDRRVKAGTEAIGHWWTATEVVRLGERCGYAVSILKPSAALHVAHYRFDALLTPNSGE